MVRQTSTRTRWARRLRSERGQGLVEFAIVLPFLCTLILALIQFGILWNNYETLTDATRAGARMAVVSHNTAQATQAVRDSAYGMTLCGTCVTVSPDPPSSPGTQVTVTATTPYSINLPIIGTVMSGTLTSTTKERIE